MNYTYKFNYEVKNNFSGYEQLLALYSETKNLMLNDINIDFSNCNWFEANLSAVLGAIITKLQNSINSVHTSNLPDGIKSILSRNSFLSNFGGELTPDFQGTTIPYKKFRKDDQKIFLQYISNRLLAIQDLPKMSYLLKKKIKECLLEIFINARIHGDTESIFSCGQFYPQKGKIDFSIVNLGSTIQKNVSHYRQPLKISSVEAIEWAIQEGNTTRNHRDQIPGGMGLSTLLSFIKLNKGRVQIISGNGYWENSQLESYKNILFANCFDGTIVNIEFNVNDKYSYSLSNERSQENLFF